MFFRKDKGRGHESPHPVCRTAYLQFFLVCLVLQPGMVSFRLFMACCPVDTDPCHDAGLREDLQTRCMADAALFAVGYVRGVSEPWGVVAEPVSLSLHRSSHTLYKTLLKCEEHNQCR